MGKANYRKIAEFYDDGRHLSEWNAERWLELIRERSGAERGAAVLDLGCGTGRFALPMARRLGFKVTGADLSPEMLAKARQKDTKHEVTWDRQDAERLTYADGSFNVVFMSHLLHHVGRPATVIAECYRVLRASGVLLIRYGAIEQISDDVEHRLFAGTVEIDKARTPSVQDTARWLQEAGFSDVTSEEIVQRTYADGQAHLRAVRARSTSVLTMIRAEAFEEGLRRLEQHVASKPDDPWVLFDRMTLTVGRKPGKGGANA
jgi:ubiquinone/menaquinone biosynthesis C-methylase UbiE